VAEVARKEGQFLPQVLALSDPRLQTVDSEGMPQIMHTRGGTVAVLLLNVSPRTEAYKVVSQGVASQRFAVRTYKNDICVPSLQGASRSDLRAGRFKEDLGFAEEFK
jgi:hypothetical protein